MKDSIFLSLFPFSLYGWHIWKRLLSPFLLNYISHTMNRKKLKIRLIKNANLSGRWFSILFLSPPSFLFVAWLFPSALSREMNFAQAFLKKSSHNQQYVNDVLKTEINEKNDMERFVPHVNDGKSEKFNFFVYVKK